MAVVLTDDLHVEMAEIAINSADRATDISLQYLRDRDFRNFGMLVMDVGTYVERAFTQCATIGDEQVKKNCVLKTQSGWSDIVDKLEVGLKRAK